jgi:hypothetical protein
MKRFDIFCWALVALIALALMGHVYYRMSECEERGQVFARVYGVGYRCVEVKP